MGALEAALLDKEDLHNGAMFELQEMQDFPYEAPTPQ